MSFGAGCVEGLPEALGSRRAVVVAFPMAEELGIEARLSRALGDRLVQWVPCPDDIASLSNALRLCGQVWPVLDAHPDAVLIGIGGGTVLDLAKVARCRPVASDGDAIAAALRGKAPWPQLQPATLWLVPTTAGTGSEVTRWATVWDTDAHPHAKLSLDEPFGYAQRAWIDPLLTLTCPSEVTRDSGVDALGHALESIWNRHANPVSDAIALAARRQLFTHYRWPSTVPMMPKFAPKSVWPRCRRASHSHRREPHLRTRSRTSLPWSRVLRTARQSRSGCP